MILWLLFVYWVFVYVDVNLHDLFFNNDLPILADLLHSTMLGSEVTFDSELSYLIVVYDKSGKIRRPAMIRVHHRKNAKVCKKYKILDLV